MILKVYDLKSVVVIVLHNGGLSVTILLPSISVIKKLISHKKTDFLANPLVTFWQELNPNPQNNGFLQNTLPGYKMNFVLVLENAIIHW